MTGAHGLRGVRFALFAECLLTGVWVTLAALPLVTALPAFAAGSAHLERHWEGEHSGLRRFLADLRTATRRGGWRWSALWCAVLALLVHELYLASASDLPGGPAWSVAGTGAVLLLLAGGVRAAARYRAEGDWRACVSGAARQSLRTDRAGTGLVAAGWVVVAVSAWMIPPLAAPALGALTGCAVSLRDR